MSNFPLTSDQERAIRAALEASWPTQSAFFSDVPALNMCRQTAVVVCERFGGEILVTTVRNVHGDDIEHFYNRIGGETYDFTESQFLTSDFVNPTRSEPVVTTIQNAAARINIDLPRMRKAFLHALNLCDAG